MKFQVLIAILLLSTVAPALAGLHCKVGQYSVRAHHRRGYVRLDGVVVSEANVKAHCKDLSIGSAYTVERIRAGRPAGWPHAIEQQSRWSEDEKQRVIEAFDGIPEALLSKKIVGIYRLKKSKDFPNPASHADGAIVVYDSAFGIAHKLEQILAHELAHQNYDDLSERERQDYRRVGGWHMELEPDGKIYWVGRKDGYIEEDGKNSQEEDYANNLEYFLFNPDKLKKVTPGVYSWIENHFGRGFGYRKETK